MALGASVVVLAEKERMKAFRLGRYDAVVEAERSYVGLRLCRDDGRQSGRARNYCRGRYYLLVAVWL